MQGLPLCVSHCKAMANSCAHIFLPLPGSPWNIQAWLTRLFFTADTSFSTAEQQMQEFLQLTIIPIVEQWEEEFNRKLLTPQDYQAGVRVRFDTDALVRADVVATANKNQMAIRGGWLRPNEVRRRENLPDDPNGNTLLLSRDLLPASIITEHPEMLLNAASGAKTSEETDGKGDTK